MSENSDVMTFTDDILSDAEDFSSEDSEAMSNSEWCFEDDIITDMCICGAGGRAHKKDCPMSSRNRYPSCILFPKVPPGDSLPAHTDSTCKSNVRTADTTVAEARSTKPGKRHKREKIQRDRPPTKKHKPCTSSFNVGDYVCIHDNKLVKHHVPCVWYK